MKNAKSLNFINDKDQEARELSIGSLSSNAMMPRSFTLTTDHGGTFEITDLEVTLQPDLSGYGLSGYGKGICKEDIEKVIFNPPATIVYFSDGDKVVVKTTDDEEYQPEVGVAMAIVKKVFKERGRFKKLIYDSMPKKLCPSCKKHQAIYNYDYGEYLCKECGILFFVE